MPPETDVITIAKSHWDSLARELRETDIELVRLREDVKVTGQMLLDEAIRRDWCDEFDDFVETLPLRITTLFPKRPRRHQITLEYSVHVTFDVHALDEDSAVAAGRTVYNGLQEHTFFHIPNITDDNVSDTDISWNLHDITAAKR